MKQVICDLKNLQCHRCDERDGDELFIKFEGKRIWPVDKKFVRGGDNSLISVNQKLTVKHSTEVTLELWDYNFITNDLLGKFIFVVDEEGQFKSDLRKSDPKGCYSYTLEVLIYPILISNSVKENAKRLKP